MGHYGMKMVIRIKANGKTFKLMGGVYIIQKKGLFLEEIGLVISKMDSV